jgi:hypothetical protein
MLISIITASARFGYVYYDSIKYIAYMGFWDATFAGVTFTGVIPAPFIFRPILPFVASVCHLVTGVNDVYLFACLNMLGIALLSVVMLYYIEKFNVLDMSSGYTAAVFAMINLPTIYYGGAILSDAWAMLFIGLIVIFTLGNRNPYLVGSLVFIGMFVKEIVLFTTIFVVLYGGRKYVFPMLVSIFTHLCMRIALGDGLSSGLAFSLNIDWLYISKIILPTFAIPIVVLFIAYLGRNFDRNLFNICFKVFKYLMIAFIPLVLFGLFFAYFDARFVWPMYFGFAPMFIYAVNYLMRKLQGRIYG